MKIKVALLLIAITASAFCASPFGSVKRFFAGETGWIVSIGALGAANAADYKTTVQVVNSGAGYEANSILTTNGVLNQNHLVEF